VVQFAQLHLERLLNGRRWWVCGWQVSSDARAHGSRRPTRLRAPANGFHDSPFPW